jgi:hypothetical protein
MQLGVDLTKEPRDPSRPFAAQWKPAVVIALFVLALKQFGGHEPALPIWGSIAALALAFATKWKLRRRAWFWIVMAVFVVAHVLAVVFASSWENWVSVKGFVLLVVLDWLVMIWVLGLAGKAMGEHRIVHRPHQRPKPATKEPGNRK